jgi:hypothetical protein
MANDVRNEIMNLEETSFCLSKCCLPPFKDIFRCMPSSIEGGDHHEEPPPNVGRTTSKHDEKFA